MAGLHVISSAFLKSAIRPDQYPNHSLPEIAFAGRSNVGKSSLINVLVRRKKLVRTSSTPGHTRLLNFYTVNDAICLVDLPGYGYARISRSTSRQWKPMIETYLTGRTNLKGVVVILDARREPTREDLDLLETLKKRSIPTLVVITKMDKLKGNQRRERPNHLKKLLSEHGITPVPFSAVTGEGREEVWTAVLNTLNHVPASGAPGSELHGEGLVV